ncbi:hypothetical protein HS088_TW03G00484 [Tripterygium wilfordii]|uniref:PUM-HD domain-containing protein n=1 Tax=Tripterygium wilfordii TaxID=458696 RepID=A0A7J7DUV4_TRIWF|nr:hypothetical protein HS088_TW03G00484 [Tripterygium wilfordii]
MVNDPVEEICCLINGESCYKCDWDFNYFHQWYIDYNRKLFEDILKTLEKKDRKLISGVFDSLIDTILMLMTDQDGHRMFVKLIESCEEDQLLQIVLRISKNYRWFLDALCGEYGSISMNKLIQVHKKSPLISIIVRGLSIGFFNLMTNRHGASVIFQCLEILTPKKNKLLFIAATENCLRLTTHQHGCKSFQIFMEQTKGSYKDKLLDIVSDHAVSLSQDSFGNHAVQRVLDLKHPVYTAKICRNLKGHYVRLSMLKGGSFVVEKCLRPSPVMNFVVKDLLQSGRHLQQLAGDQYGKYVIQTALEVTKVAEPPLHRKLEMELEQYQNHLADSRYGKNAVRSLVSSF